ncbi:MAG: HAD family phosphatase [Gammaproteobacteria bacterium]|jgi:HAD superfamily hydrolase (TIGR01490 family)|nr:HAD family phosphatase [Gammaproteobacteria bacterium]
MSVALFDLDNTLLGGDSDYLWGRFLVLRGVVDGEEYERRNREFYERYHTGTLDIYEFARFAYRPLADNPLSELNDLRSEYVRELIRPIVLPAALELLERHRRRGDRAVIITATNRFVTRPIADELGVTDLIATEPEFRDGAYTGELAGIPCFREGKVERLRLWLQENGEDLEDSWFYSDSHNDIPLLEQVTHAVAVDPDDTLRRVAAQRGWPVISLREPQRNGETGNAA